MFNEIKRHQGKPIWDKKRMYLFSITLIIWETLETRVVPFKEKSIDWAMERLFEYLESKWETLQDIDFIYSEEIDD
jgi:hypothetical protein